VTSRASKSGQEGLAYASRPERELYNLKRREIDLDKGEITMNDRAVMVSSTAKLLSIVLLNS
jgi:hypothetical protein